MDAAKLTRRAKISPALLARAEGSDGEPCITIAQAAAIQRALEAAGVEFIVENGGGPGVRLRK